MTATRPIARLKVLLAAGVLALGSSTAGLAYASGIFSAAQPTSPTTYTVDIAGGHNGDDFTNFQYTPDTLNVFVGDSVTFTNADSIEPHTVSFGTYSMLAGLSNQFLSVQPNHGGPPTLALLPKVVEPTARTTYDGTGFANSGILSSAYGGLTHDSWTIKLTVPGTYQYYCLVHFPFMIGTIIVNPRPGATSPYTVQAGYGGFGLVDATSEATTFLPGALTVHVGNIVQFVGGFHTVTFGTPTQIANLRTQFVQRAGSSGNYKYSINPQVAFPSSTNGCGTSAPCAYSGGFLNSGFLSSPGSGGGGSFLVKFTKAGVYNYGCLIHKGMDGTITVLPPGASSKT
jgi:plastocyanin